MGTIFRAFLLKNLAGRWKKHAPDIIVRAHRHRAVNVGVPAQKADGKTFMAQAIVCPAFCLKNPYSIQFSPESTPQVGGWLIRLGEGDYIFSRSKVWGVVEEEIEKV